MPDRSVSPPIPDEAVEVMAARGLHAPPGSLSEALQDLYRREARADLEAAAPALYKAWGEVLVRRIREEGAKDAAPNEGYDGPLHEAISDAAGSHSSEFWPTDRVVEGVADYVASLLGLDGKDG